MPLHVSCPTQKAVLLLGFYREEGPIVFPSQDVNVPGLHVNMKPLLPVYDQFLTAIHNHFSLNFDKNFELDQSFSEKLKIEEVEATLYIGSIKAFSGPYPRYLHSLPHMIRQMPKTSLRLPYLKAWQVLMGSPQDEIRALEVKEEDQDKYF